MARFFHLQTSEHSTILDVTVWVRELDSLFFFGAFLFETGGKKQPCLAARKSTENMQHLLHYELVTDTQDKLGLVRRMCKKLYALHLNIHNNFPDSLSSC